MTKRTLAEWRKRKELSQTELAKLAKVSRPTIARYEAEGFASAQLDTVLKILKELDITLDQLEFTKEDK